MVERRIRRRFPRCSPPRSCITGSRRSIRLRMGTAARAGRWRCGSCIGAGSIPTTSFPWTNFLGGSPPLLRRAASRPRARRGSDFVAGIHGGRIWRSTLERVWRRHPASHRKIAGSETGAAPQAGAVAGFAARAGRMSPAAIWAALKISKQGAIDLLATHRCADRRARRNQTRRALSLQGRTGRAWRDVKSGRYLFQ